MGHELTFTVQLEGIEETFLDGIKCEVHIEELCDDTHEVERADFEIKGMKDTC